MAPGNLEATFSTSNRLPGPDCNRVLQKIPDSLLQFDAVFDAFLILLTLKCRNFLL
jgi:hypothetical protein